MALAIPPNFDRDLPLAWGGGAEQEPENHPHVRDQAPGGPQIHRNGHVGRPEGFALRPPPGMGLTLQDMLGFLVIAAIIGILVTPVALTVKHYRQARARRARVSKTVVATGERLRQGAADLVERTYDRAKLPTASSLSKRHVAPLVADCTPNAGLSPPEQSQPVLLSTRHKTPQSIVVVGHRSERHAMVADRIYTLACENPTWCAGNISSWLTRRGIEIESEEVQAVLHDLELATRTERMLNTEYMHLNGSVLLTQHTVHSLESFNPCLTERDVRVNFPGEVLAHDYLSCIPVRGGDSVRLHLVVDTFSSYAFVLPFVGSWPSHSAEVMREHLVPQYQEWGIPVQSVLTSKHSLFWGKESHPYVVCLRDLGIQHVFTNKRHHGSSAYMLRFKRILEREFLRPGGQTRHFASLDGFRTKLQEWTVFYNHKRPHEGYPNMGVPPAVMVDPFVRKAKAAID